MPLNRRVMRRLRAIYDPHALCYGLQQIILEQQQACAHDFTHTRAIVAQYAPDVDAAALVAVLEDAGAHCDCEVIYNVCAAIYDK